MEYVNKCLLKTHRDYSDKEIRRMRRMLWILRIPIVPHLLPQVTCKSLVQLFKNFLQHLDPEADAKEAQKEKEFMRKLQNVSGCGRTSAAS